MYLFWVFFFFAVVGRTNGNLLSLKFERNDHHGPTHDEKKDTFLDLKGEKLLMCIAGFIHVYTNAHLRKSAHV